MERTFGRYPFGKYRTVQCPTRWGGFEAPGNVQLSESLFDTPRGVGTLAHELAHMWFGCGVGYAEWREVWLSEGFASYFGPWLFAESGGPPFVDSLAAMRDRWRRSADGRTKSVRWVGFAHPDLALNANTYPKGAWVLHMLRRELGDAAFFAALHSYFETFAGQSIVTADFVAHVERSAGRSLSWFFDQWLDRRDCPHLEARVEDGFIVVEQTQAAAPFRCALDLAWRDDQGVPRTATLQLTDRLHRLPVPGGAHELQLDPDTWLLYR